MSSFLQGVQVGANMFAQAQQLRAQREAYRMQAQQMMQNMQTARALDAYRQQQLMLQQSEEKRRQAEFQQQQNLIAERDKWVAGRQGRLDQFMNRFDLIPPSMRPTEEQFNQREADEFAMKFAPASYPSMVRGRESAEASLERQRVGDAADLERARLTDERIRTISEAKIEAQKKAAEESATLREQLSKQSNRIRLMDLLMKAREKALLIPSDKKRDPERKAAQADIANIQRQLDELDNPQGGGKNVIGKFDPQTGEFVPAQ